MADFNPVAHVKNAIAEWHASDDKMVIGAGIPEMVDYIDALRAALREAAECIDGACDGNHGAYDPLSHTVRHLLDD